ncbi:MAG TPA: DUF433 domain-containing protein [Chloroflexia bacterium]|nr:DUF433 domain-containing protein [Chloroflexia bacterium]
MIAQELITRNPNILGGTPVFAGTRVPVDTLFDYLEAGDSLDRFLDHFPTVERAQAVAVLEFLREVTVSQAAGIQPLLPSILEALETIKIGDLVRIGGDVEERT